MLKVEMREIAKKQATLDANHSADLEKKSILKTEDEDVDVVSEKKSVTISERKKSDASDEEDLATAHELEELREKR